MSNSQAMAQPAPSAPISSERDIVAHTINTGQIVQHTQLHFTVIVDSLEQLAERLGQPEGALRLSTSGALEAVAGQQVPLALPDNLLEAWRLLPRAVDAALELRRRAYAAWLVTQRPAAPPQAVAARQQYVPWLAG